jgi:hypothetical protein
VSGGRSRRIARASFAIGAIATAIAAASIAIAHQVGLSRGDYSLVGNVVQAELVFARGELISTVPDLDANGDGRLTPDEVDAARARLEATIVKRVVVTADGAPCPGQLTAAHLTEEDGVAVRGTFRCPNAPAKARVELALLDDLAHGHRHVARARGENGEIEEVLFRGRAGFDVPRGSTLAPDPSTKADAKPAAAATPSRSAVALGFGSFVGQYLHAAFLLAVLAVAISRRARLEVAGAFVIGALIGLALAGLGIWAPDARAVVPAVAVSVLYVGVSGLIAKADRTSRLTAAAFGGVHGFALASALGPHDAGDVARFALGAGLAATAITGAWMAIFAMTTRSEKARASLPRLAGALATIVGVVATVRALG